MALAPIVTIPVDDSEFEKFKAAFGDYHEKLKTMPADWQAVNQRIVELAKVQRQLGVSADRAWANATNAANQYDRAVQAAAKSQLALYRQTHGAGTAMHKMAESAKGIASHLGSAFRSMTRFAAFGIGGGVLGLGGLAFGFDRLADSVLAKSRQARSLGLSVGAMNSFNVHLARVAGPGVLANAAQAQLQPEQAGNLAVLGIPWQQAVHESATKLAGQELLSIHRAFARNPAMFGMTAEAHAGQALGFNMLEMQNIGRTPEGTLRRDLALAASDKGALGFSDQVAREWSNLSIQLHKAGTEIETDLVNALAKVAPSIGALSNSVASLINGLSQSGEVKKWVDALSVGIKDFAVWLGSPEFHRDLKTFGTDVAAVAKGLERALEWLGLIPHQVPGTETLSRHQATPVAHPNPVVQGIERREAIAQRRAGAYAPDKLHALIAADAKKYGVPAGLMTRLATAESSFGQAPDLVSPKGAEGLFQVMPQTGRDFGVSPSDLMNPSINADVGFRLMRRLLQRYHGDQAKAVAAYNWGTRNLDQDIAKHGANWLSFAPAETQGEVAKVVPAASLPAPRKLTSPAPRRIFPGGTILGPSEESPGEQIRRQARALYEREFGKPAPHLSPSSGAASVANWMQPSDIATVRSRFWQTHKGVNVKVQNNAAGQVHLNVNAAAGP